MLRYFSTTIFALANLQKVLAQQCDGQLTTDYEPPIAANGWEYALIGQGFNKPRSLLFDTEGALLVLDSSVGVIHLKLEDSGGTCLSIESQTILVDNPELNHGLALSEDGETLYASSPDKVYAWAYDAQAISISGSNRTIVANMSNSDHTTRTLLLSKNSPGFLIVSRGSDANEDPDAENIESGHSQIRAFEITSLEDDSIPYDFSNDGVLLGWGLRNSVGVAEEPLTGGIWSVENSVDDLRRNGVDIHHDNPGEELNFHGYLNGSTVSQGGNYGYPGCYALWSTDNFPDLGTLETGDQFSTAETTVLSDDICNSDYEGPRLTFQAHTAPLDIKFNSDGSRSYITFHGSWNREDPVGYTLSMVEFSRGSPKAESNSQTATKTILENADLSACPDACFRPVGLAIDNEDRIFMTSDTTGEIFVLIRTGEETPDSSDDPTPTDSAEDPEESDNAATNTRAFKSTIAWLPILVSVASGLGLLI